MSNDENGSTANSSNVADFLLSILSELGSHVGAIWVDNEGQLVPSILVGLDDCGLFSEVEGKKFLQQILTDTLRQGRAQTFDTEGLIEPRETGHATLFLSPLLTEGALPGVILIAERPNLPQQQRLGLMRHIELRCQELSRQAAMATSSLPRAAIAPQISPSLNPMAAPVMISAATAPSIVSSPSTSVSSSSTDSQAVLDYVLSLQRSLDLNEVANVIVNDGRILFEVDRVGLAVCHGRKVFIKAVSGQESVHPRGNLIRALQRLTQRIVKAGEPFRFDGSINSVPKQLEEPLAAFIQESGTRFLLVVPLVEPERLVKPEEPMGGGRPQRIIRKTIGALIIEQMTSSEPSSKLKATLDSVTDHIAAATYNAGSHSSIFLLPLWRSLGRLFEWLRGRRLAIACVISVAIGVAGVALAVVPWEYRVDARGLLMPVTQRDVFAPEDGQVDVLFVHGDELVNEGDKLISLVNHELEAEKVKVQNVLREKQKLWLSLKNEENEAEKAGKEKTIEKLKIRGKRFETQAEIDGTQLQLEELNKRLERLVVRAPIKGKVTTFQVQQLLLNRPVKRGEVLLQVMDEEGEWQLELEIEEHRVGRVLKAQSELSAELPIDYRLLTSPQSSYTATLGFLATRTVTAEEKGSVLEARATLDKSKLPKRTIGALVRARIGCGESYLGDVLFGDVIEFIQKYLWW